MSRACRRWALLLTWATLPMATEIASGQSVPAALQPSGWDDARVQALVERARERRQVPQRDTALRNYTARAEGFVYFYLDRRDTGERTLIRTDQVALEVYWAPPARTKQRIVGLRDESRLPNRMHYHLDHLTVVQDGLGDVIRMGDGDEVGDVPHPAASGSDSIYSFRVADSLTIRLPGQGTEIRVYEVEVRPRRVDRPALVGSMFVDRGTADIVRMTFTFTPVSYVDRRLDYINVSLDNGLWEGRYWLPNEQTLQIRRQIPELDFGAGTVIQGRMRITDYTFNDSIAPGTFGGYPVVAVSREERERFAFERGIHEDLDELGLAPPPDLADIRRQAVRLLGTSRLSGLPPWRVNVESASSVLRYNRAEGLALGAGISYVPGTVWRTDAAFGHAFGAGQPWGSMTMRRSLVDGGDVRLRLYGRELRDAGSMPAVPLAINSLTGMFGGDDYTDPYHADGARLGLHRGIGRGVAAVVTLAAERQRSAVLTQSHALFRDGAAFRPILPIDEGDVVSLQATVRRVAPDPRSSSWSGAISVEAGLHEGEAWLRPVAEAALRRSSADRRLSVAVNGDAGYVSLDAPSQRMFLIGGTGTLPGYDYRSFIGRWFFLVRAEASAGVLDPWLRVRAVGAAASTGGAARAPDDAGPPLAAWHTWPVRETSGFRTSLGAGVSLFWDLLRVDAVRGLDGGRWRLQFSFHREFWDIG